MIDPDANGRVALPSDLTSVPPAAFANCASLRHVVFGHAVSIVGENAFQNCTLLASVSLPSSVQAVRRAAFVYCSGLRHVTFAPSSSTVNVGGVCDGCHALELVSGLVPDSYTTKSAFPSCLGYGLRLAGAQGLPQGGDVRCLPCTVANLTIPDTVVSIGADAFKGCTMLERITFPSALTYVGFMAFDGAASLTSVELPVTVTFVGRACRHFVSTAVLTATPARTTTPPAQHRYAFRGARRLIRFVVPDAVRELSPDICPSCESLRWVYTPVNLMSNAKAFPSCLGYGLRLRDQTSPTQFPVGNSSCLGIGPGNTLMVVPDTVVQITERTFMGFGSLTAVYLPPSLTLIASEAFALCGSLRSVSRPAEIASVSPNAFDKSACALPPYRKVDVFNCTDVTNTTTNTTTTFACSAEQLAEATGGCLPSASAGAVSFRQCLGQGSCQTPAPRPRADAGSWQQYAPEIAGGVVAAAALVAIALGCRQSRRWTPAAAVARPERARRPLLSGENDAAASADRPETSWGEEWHVQAQLPPWQRAQLQ